MESRWSDGEAAEFIARFAPRWGEDLALRVYTSRLIGRDPDLVLHGGGNTSLKGTVTTLVGERVEALFVKGSGWDLAAIEPPGLPAVDLVHLRKLRARQAGGRGLRARPVGRGAGAHEPRPVHLRRRRAHGLRADDRRRRPCRALRARSGVHAPFARPGRPAGGAAGRGRRPARPRVARRARGGDGRRG